MQQIALTFSSRDNNDDSDLIAVAQAADRLGYHSFWTGESWGRDAFTVLTMLACHTDRIGLGTGIVTVYSRTPGLIAQSIASLDCISGGRAILGLGSSGRIVIEDWHGVKFDHPVSRTREYIEIVRMALAGGRVNYDGRFYQLQRFRMGVAPVQERVPIYIASLGQRNLELTGELADGWLPIWTHSEKLPQIKEPLLAALTAAGRQPGDMTTAPQILSCASDDEETVANAIRQARAHIAFYIGGMGRYYYDLFCRYGYQAEGDAVRRAWAEGDRGAAAGAITDEMVHGITAIGTPEECRRKMDRFRANGVDMPLVAFPHGAERDTMLGTLEALAPGKA
ncbi:MAG: LLM class flavin-dependent oxidoreductase [Chloroflexota bacterium]|nr:LLM class flavin-dependent oxidoreductase [Chloroflexota bacterium]MDE2685792.1 LLM class flavin-dependent oxidoreductase [Chloroflexota bacterium]